MKNSLAAWIVGVGLCLAAGAGALASCSSSTGSAIRKYSGTAGVGDFIQIEVDPTMGEISYENISNDTTDTVSFIEDADGSYDVTDPSGNIITAFEIPGFAMVMHIANGGATEDIETIVIAIDQQPIANIPIEGRNQNLFQFRTNQGGFNTGYFNIDTNGAITNGEYWPWAYVSGQPGQAFQVDTAPLSTVADLVPDSTGSFFVVDEGGGMFSYVFATTGGFFAVDNANGAIICFEQRVSGDLLPSDVGTYHGLLYQKLGADEVGGDEVGGTLDIFKTTVTVTVGGVLTVKDEADATVVTGTLVPIADSADLSGVGKLEDPMKGLFTFRITAGSDQTDVVVAFLNRAMLLGYFKHDTGDTSGTYDYFYGAALKQ